jgi:hypothetical protein
MSMEEDADLDREAEQHDDADHDDPAPAEDVKKPNKSVMVVAVAAAVVVFGFAGMQVYKKMAKPSPGLDQSMMAAPTPAAPAAQALVPAGVQPDPAQSGTPASAAPAQEMRMLSTAELGGATGATPTVQRSSPAVGSTPTAQPVLQGGSGPSVQAASAAFTGASQSGPIDMSALQGLKSQQEAQGKRIDTFDDRLSKIESRVSQLSGGERVVRVDAAPKRVWQPKKPVVKKPLVKSKGKADKTDQKDGEDAHPKAEVTQVVKLPPAPADLSKAEAKPEAEKVVGRVNGLRIQAVIPGRAWVQEDGGATRSYALGDAIRPGVVVRGIDAEKGVVETSAGAIR